VPLLKIGVRYPTVRDVGKEEVVRPGVVYEAVYESDKEIDEGSLWRVKDFIAEVRKKYPGININYLEVCDDKRTVIIQFYDEYTPAVPGVVIAVVTALALILGIVIATTLMVREVKEAGLVPKLPGREFWVLIGIGVATGSIASLIAAVKKK